MERMPNKDIAVEAAPTRLERLAAKAVIPELYSATSVADFSQGAKEVIGYARTQYNAERAKWPSGIERLNRVTETPDKLFARLRGKEYHPIHAANVIIYVPIVRHDPDQDPKNLGKVTLFDATGEQQVNLLKDYKRIALQKLLEEGGSTVRLRSRSAIRSQMWQSDVIIGATYDENEKNNEFLLLHVINRHVTEPEKMYLLGLFARLQARGVGIGA